MNRIQVPTTFAHPEQFPIPRKGLDPFFGQSRSAIYDLESRGLLTLVRVVKPGRTRGRTFVRFDDMAAAMRKLTSKRKSKMNGVT